MAICDNFEGGLMKALRSLEQHVDSLVTDEYSKLTADEFEEQMSIVDDRRIFRIAEAIRRGYSYEKIHQITMIDPWFIDKIAILVEMETRLKTEELTPDLLKEAKRIEFPDKLIASLNGKTEDQVKKMRYDNGITAAFKMVDTCAAEFAATTPYYYSVFGSENEAKKTEGRKKVLVLGSGPIRIGQGIEFDFCSVHCTWAFAKEGYETVIINNNPETVSTDFDIADKLYFETGYGTAVGVSDEEYAAYGCHIVPREQALACDIITDVKLGDADYLDEINSSKIMFGWAHTVQNIDFTSDMIRKKHTVVAWEEIFEHGRYIFYRNREVAGEAAVMQAFRYCGKMPYDTCVAILGNGQTAKGAMRILHGLGARVDVYSHRLEQLFRKNMFDYDVLINCVMWDTTRTDRIIYKEDLKKMKPGTLIIDVSCDPHLEIETSHPTTIDDPVYVVDGVIHYAVDNTPAMYPITVTKVLSEGISNYIDIIIEKDFDEYPESLKKATVIKDGHIRDERIAEFRKARGVFCE